MEKDIGQTSKLKVYSDLSIIRDEFNDVENGLYIQTYQELAGILNIENITTPLISLPLNIGINRIIKRSFDILFSLILIIGLLSWLIPIIAILICVDSKGPVFFLQKRNKKNGGLFTCLKFRSMVINAEADILPASYNDARITKVGRFLRNHYLDELPQLFNVLLGDMSVIGPRPLMISDSLKYEEEISYYSYRNKIKPGITGLAQILGYVGAAEDVRKMKDRVNIDIFYSRHWSFKMDMVIIVKTIGQAFKF